MLSDPTWIEEEKLLGLHLMVFLETLAATAAPSQPQQLCSSTLHGVACSWDSQIHGSSLVHRAPISSSSC